MKNIRVNKEKLLETLRGNRHKHRAIFEEALAGYRKEAVRLLEEELSKVRAGKRFNPSVFYHLEVPKDESRSYDRVIGMLEMEIATEVELSEQDYAQYVMDDWAWKRNFLGKMSSYSVSAQREAEALGDE